MSIDLCGCPTLGRLNGSLGRMVNARGVGESGRRALDGGSSNGYSSSSRVK